jgi:hypothetical protein
MQVNDHQIWRVWAGILYRWGLEGWAASVIEALGPLSILGAQIVYLGEPFLGSIVPTPHLKALGEMLDEPDQAREFASFLRETAKS